MIFITYQSNIKMETFDDSGGIYNESTPEIALDKNEIWRIQAGLKDECPTRDFARLTDDPCHGVCTGQFGICYECGKRYGLTKEERLARGYDWVQALVADIKAKTYKDAERIYFERHYMVNMDISDIA